MRIPFDLFIWLAALIGIALIPLDVEAHLSICPIHNLGFSWCPGCGLGRSMKYLMVGDWQRSWEMHPLGGFAFLVIGIRLVEIIKHIKTIKNYG
ncbi:MAG: DUF2752 domain-containing protein [Lunatimonas sp.]|uniref:DUF2752 domain-containing protein n=1 Tax=Lunatimonas sp. TaxID=2060141 RepID=UPI00263B751C|nr:DUF2752 domain-containing protein [Lunatimonas sp.]MCC5939572.1 DUF2752 domain-containing protein [Lunatimonas sp.]